MMPLHLPGWLVGLFVATLALGTDEFVIAGLLPELADDLQVSTGMAGQLISVFALTFAIGAPVMAVVLDPYPRRRVILAALAVFVVANVAAALAPTFGALIVLRAIAGLAAAVVSSTAFAAAAQGAPPDRQGRYLAVVTAGLTVALFTGVPVGAWVGSLLGWRSTFVLVAIVALAAIVVLALGLPRLEGAATAGLAERLRPLRSARVLRLVLAVFLCGVGGLMFYSYLSALLEQHQGGTDTLPLVLLLVGVIGVPSAFLGGRLADRYGGRRSRLMVVGGHAIALAATGALLALGAPFPLLLAGIAAWSVFAWALNPPLQASTIEAAPEAPMTAISLNISGLYLGTAAAAAIGGIIVDGPGVLWIPFAAAISLTLAWISASFRTPQPATAAA
ncbi:MFS transporter [Streptomyces cavernicola]|uniref:MFS transporter n=1 Tax=Streptomyces cavernicola TaxID=3043613 RepID=A0ABT6SFK9_9ACTN|nr:MFS transporter [Streptomyces sp. B-S-A6]MDI3406223.1 MFS transporter [Streptomyces sp. B-S-A6]